MADPAPPLKAPPNASGTMPLVVDVVLFVFLSLVVIVVMAIGEIEGITIPVPIVEEMGRRNWRLEPSSGLVDDAVAFFISGHAS